MEPIPFTQQGNVIRLEPGRRVICDWMCGEEYTDSTARGGLMFESKAVCPKCAPECEASAKKYEEEHAIRARCPEGISFADWVRDIVRGGR